TKNSVKTDKQQAGNNRAYYRTDQLFAKPLSKVLSGQAVSVFPEEMLVNIKRKPEQRREQNKWDGVEDYLHRFKTRYLFSEIAQARGNPRCHQEEPNRGRHEKVPADRPVAAFEVSV